MSATSDKQPDLEALFIAFCDEETEVWRQAALSLGALAVEHEEARNLLLSTLKQEDNHHRRRHACCAAAAYLSHCEQADASVLECLDALIFSPWDDIAFRFAAEQLPWAAVAALHPHWADRLTQRQAEAIAKRTKALLHAPEAQHGKIQEALENLKALPDLDAPGQLQTIIGQKEIRVPDELLWCFASYQAGVSSAKALTALPLYAWTDVPIGLAASRNQFPLVVNLPRLISNGLEAPQRKEAFQQLTTQIQPGWVEHTEHFVQFVGSVSDGDEAQWQQLWQRGLQKPMEPTEWIQSGLLRGDPAVLRTLTSQIATDTWLAQDLGHDKFALLSLAFAGLTACESQQTSSIDRRIALLIEQLHRDIDLDDDIYVALVRALKILLHRQLDRTKQSTRSGHRHADFAQGQIHLITPLIQRWDQSQTLRKDLATIAVRCLMHAARSPDRKALGQVLYSLLMAHPDPKIIEEMSDYCPGAWGPDAQPTHYKPLAEVLHQLSRTMTPATTLKETWANYAAFGEALASAGVESLEVAGQPQASFPGAWASLIRELLRPTPTILSNEIKEQLQSWLAFGFQSQRIHQRLVARRQIQFLTAKDARGRQEQWADLGAQISRQMGEESSALLPQLDALYRLLVQESSEEKDYRKKVQNWADLSQLYNGLIGRIRNTLPLPEAVLLEQHFQIQRDHWQSLYDERLSILAKANEEDALGQTQMDGEAASPHRVFFLTWLLHRSAFQRLSQAHGFTTLRLITHPILWPVLLLLPALVVFGLDLQSLNRSSSCQAFCNGYLNHRFGLLWLAVDALILWGLATGLRARFRGLKSRTLFVPAVLSATGVSVYHLVGADDLWNLQRNTGAYVDLIQLLLLVIAGLWLTRQLVLAQQFRLTQLAGIRSLDFRPPTWKRAWETMGFGVWQSALAVRLVTLLTAGILGRPEWYYPGQEAGTSQDILSGCQCLMGPANDLLAGGAPHWLTRIYGIGPLDLLVWTLQVYLFAVIFREVLDRRE